jgi:hypothetical protein
VRRLRPLDATLLAVSIGLWLTCFGLQARELLRGPLAWIPVTVSAAQTSARGPRVSGFWPDSEAETAALRVGDEIVRVGHNELGGAGPFRFAGAVYTATGPDLSVRAEIVRQGETRWVAFRLRPVGASWRLPLLSLGFALPGFLVLWRRPGTRSGRAVFAACLCYSLNWTFFFGGPPAQTYLWIAVFGITTLSAYPLLFWAVLSVPDPASGSLRRSSWVWLFALYGVAGMSWVFGIPFSPALGVRAGAALNALAPLTVLVLLTRAYIHSGAIGRRQLRWILYGFYVGALPVAVGSLLPVVTPGLWWLYEVLMVGVVLIPVCFFIAIVRFNFLDIDRLISVTLSYNILLVLLAGVGALAVPRAGEAASSALGLDPRAGQSALSLLLVVVLLPAHRRLRPRIDRVLFAERYAVEQGVEELIQELPGCATTEELAERVGVTLYELLRPESCSLYARSARGYARAFEESSTRQEPASYPDQSPLVTLLRRRPAPLVLEQTGRGQQAPLDIGSEAAVVVGVWEDADLLGFLCLGAKRSGDVYTSTDLALLSELAERLAVELSRI